MTESAIPEHLLYFYNDPACAFMSISDCPARRVDVVLDEKNEGNTFFASRFSREKRKQYLQHRALIEARLWADFVAKGGKPKRRFPYYAYLSIQTYAEMRPSLAGTGFADSMCLEMALSDFPSDIISFTYEDSCLSYGLVFHPEGLEEGTRGWPVVPGYGVLFRLEELGDAIGKYGFPANCYEAQIWDDAPLREYRRKIKARQQSDPGDGK